MFVVSARLIAPIFGLIDREAVNTLSGLFVFCCCCSAGVFPRLDRQSNGITSLEKKSLISKDVHFEVDGGGMSENEVSFKKINKIICSYYSVLLLY